MQRRRISRSGRVLALVALPAALALSSCGSKSSDDNSTAGSPSGTNAAVCKDVQEIRTSISQLKDIPLNRDALSTLSTKLDSINTQVHQLATDSHGSIRPQLDQLSASLDALKADVQAAAKNPSATTLSALPPAVAAVGTSAQNVSSALPNC